jgi:DeoR family ulaG and ulaABCDEF operon transcriptional repressor
LPLANYLIDDQEHDSVIIMGGQYNRSHSITLSPQGSENSLYAGHWMFTSGKGLTAEGLYKTDMLTRWRSKKCLTSANSRSGRQQQSRRTRRNVL